MTPYSHATYRRTFSNPKCYASFYPQFPKLAVELGLSSHFKYSCAMKNPLKPAEVPRRRGRSSLLLNDEVRLPAEPRQRTLRRHQIGRAHVCHPVTNAHIVCSLMLAKQKPI